MKRCKFKTIRSILLTTSLSFLLSVGVNASTTPDTDFKKSKKQLQKEYLEAQKKIWSNLTESQLKEHLVFLASRGGIYDNPKVQKYVQEVGEKILAQTPHAGQDYRFVVVDNPDPNASTLQRPVIYIHRGLLAVYQSESQLAGVIGHEIGHNIDKARDKASRKRITDSVFATTMGILAGNMAVGDAIATQQAYGHGKYSQKRELEADRLGAKYLYGAGYEAEGLISGLGSMFDYFRVQQKRNTLPYRTFSSHPREDTRLRAVVNQVGELPPGEAILGRASHREAIEGMVYGPNLRPTAPPGYVRYNNETLGITFLHPENWDRSVKGSKIILKDPEQTLQFKIEIEKTANKTEASDVAIKARYPDGLKGVTKINAQSSKDLGVVATHKSQRVGLIKVARNTYHFQGISRDNKLSKAEDDVMVGMIGSFRRLRPSDRNLAKLKRIYFEQLKPGQTFASMAADQTDENVATESELRAINGFFPRGEAEPGTWIKKIKVVKVDQNDRKAKSADGKSKLSDSKQASSG